MTFFSHLDISRVRNIDEISIDPGKQINLIHGVNGSGKTSILEAIHLLAVGRSFRSTKSAIPMIQHASTDCTVFARLDGGIAVGLQKARNQKPLLKLQGEKQANWLDVAHLIPIQVIDSNAFRLLEGSPKDRRRFLDWGVFHVEPSFVTHWRNSRKCIANRNLLLKSNRIDEGQLQAWNTELCVEAELVDRARSAYFSRFSPILEEVLRKMDAVGDISINYRRGWDNELTLTEVLKRNKDIDLRYGSTQSGPHRADIVVKHEGISAVEVLSRGQQKILVSALKLAQGAFLTRESNRRCIFLIDDLPAELDHANRERICHFMQSSGSQVFMTCVDEGSLKNSWESKTLIAKFHVEHGKMLS
jgi:DNA replication and repair protein RecF